MGAIEDIFLYRNQVLWMYPLGLGCELLSSRDEAGGLSLHMHPSVTAIQRKVEETHLQESLPGSIYCLKVSQLILTVEETQG